MKIKIINLHQTSQEKINKFIKDKKIIDIKYQATRYSDMILIMYEE